MKRIVLLLVFVFCVNLHAQRKPKIKGNKNVVEVIQELPVFSSIELKDDLDINIQNTGVEGYVLNADDNLIDVLKFKVIDGTLHISSFYKITSKKKLEITVNYQSLNSITVRAGRIRMNDVVNSEELFVHMFESSKLELNANAPLVHVNMENNSSGDFNIDTDSLSVNLKDRIDVRLYTTSSFVSMDMQDTSSAKMDGTTNNLMVSLKGKSNLKAEKLQATSVIAALIESPTARVNAQEHLELTSSGSSKTYCYGEGKIILSEFLDTSELYRRKN
ncbi:DUF2807 domain-containing protein [uncultured Maribacter sp.]|uniref:GIN domain-containing protein n=1 Tax=uncultured Maribacter sp. TaxID=431308 RepID=UPI00262E81FC|nr:DUF2807 domain-containing protein [uncultured Maribacter sp.]